MRTAVKKTDVYTFDELSDEAKEAALEKWREHGLDYEWWDMAYEDYKRTARILGIEIENIYFSGFYSQGDGACFEGEYEYAKGSMAAIRKEYPTDQTLHCIADNLAAAQKYNSYGLYAYVKHQGRYSHEMCTDIDVRNDRSADYYPNPDGVEAITEALRDFMRWIYKSLEAEWDYLMSAERIIDDFKANEYEFTIDGEMY